MTDISLVPPEDPEYDIADIDAVDEPDELGDIAADYETED